jgi:hypothetical protein
MAEALVSALSEQGEIYAFFLIFGKQFALRIVKVNTYLNRLHS